MAEDEKIYANFTVKKVQDKEREDKIEKLKADFSIEQISKLLSFASLDDMTAAEMNKALQRELKAMDMAERASLGKKKAAYEELEERTKKDGTTEKVPTGKCAENSNYYSKLDDFENLYRKTYDEYERQIAEIESREIPDAEKEALKSELLTNNPDFRDVKNRADELNTLSDQENRRYQIFEALERLPEKAQESLLQFYKDCQKPEVKANPILEHAFEDTLADYLATEPFWPHKNKDGKDINRHDFTLIDRRDKDGNPIHKVAHSVYNLNDTGLDVNIVGGKLGFTHGKPQLTEEQVRALSEYCYYNGFEITDYQKLAEMDVLSKDGKSVGKVNEEMQRHFEELRTGQEVERVTAVRDDQPLPNATFSDMLPKLKSIDPSRATMLPASEKCIAKMGFSNPNLRRITYGGNSTIISVYGNENDILVDGKLDKNGKRQHTKKFAVELSHTYPPSARFYFEYGMKINADLVRVAFDAFKAGGSQYFVVDNVLLSGGKEMGGSIMKASVKTGLVPVLKDGPKGQGGDVGPADLTTVLEELPKEPGFTAKEKVEYQMRWYDQLEKYMKGNPQKAYSLGTLAEKFKYGARFGMLTNSYMLAMEKHITAGMNGELDGKQWDTVDEIAVTKAMNTILQEISQGKLNGKQYNPIDDKNEEKLIQALEEYRKAERAKSEKLVMDAYGKELKEGADFKEDGQFKKITDQFLRSEKAALKATCDDIKSYGVEVSPHIISAKRNYIPPREQKETSRSQKRINDSGVIPTPQRPNGRSGGR